MTARPQDYRWSSVHTHLGLACEPHPLYLALGFSSDECCEACRIWLRQGMTDDDLARIRQHLNQERALGGKPFQYMVEKTLKRPAVCRPRGRPKSKIEI